MSLKSPPQPHHMNFSTTTMEVPDGFYFQPWPRHKHHPHSIPIPGFYFSAPASPVHFVLSNTINIINSYPSSAPDANASFDFDFSASLRPTAAPSPESMTSADKLFLNGQIRPMKLSTHLQRPQLLPPLIEHDDDDILEEDPLTSACGRELRKFQAGSLRWRTRSMSPSKNSTTTPFDWVTNESEISRGNNSHVDAEDKKIETTPSRSSSKWWVLLEEFLLYRSKSKGRNNEGNNKFWGSLSFSPILKDKKVITKG
ncbi:hypothetical protein PHJA_000595400 [Phtheirospermum japonicum]|uniref:Uncharacterized protein n=1 Tax=Phtheirospermum japonicum TaxID=374723 RepID=A0A830BKU6_9LAMI|nr:hypothetical protein PHJA_000595400 [Phtheirospermum japonicum]